MTKDPSLERLTAANPVDAGAPLTADEQREADRLLQRLLHEPREEPAGAAAPRRRPRLTLPRLAPVAAGALCAALAAVFVLGGGERGPTVADRAYAAVNEDFVYTFLTYSTVNGLGRDEPAKLANVYYDPVAPAYRSVQFEHYFEPGPPRALATQGVLEFEAENAADTAGLRTFAPGVGRRYDRTRQAADLDPFAAFEEAYRADDVRSEGETRFEGRPARVLVAERGGNRTTYIVDARTYLPLQQVDRQREGGRTVTVTTRYEAFERLPRTRENLRKLRFDSPYPVPRTPSAAELRARGITPPRGG